MAPLPDVIKFHRSQLGLYRRHRKLVLAVLAIACLGGIVLPFIQTATCEVANLAFAQAKTSPAVTRNLGFPLRRGPLAVGNLESRGSEGEASLSFSIYGPFGRGVLYADAVRFNQKWQLISLDLEFPGHFGRMNLMPIQSTIPR
jgi:hypothetical protein